MAAISSLLGIFSDPTSASLDPLNPDSNRKWVFSKIAPFAGRIVFERIECENDEDVHVRIVGNDQVLGLEGVCDAVC